MTRIHCRDLAPFYFAYFPQLKSDLQGKRSRFSDLDELRTESDLKIDMVW